MLNIYITRHGETIGNVNNIMQGRNNSDLTEKGKKRVKSLGKRLNNIHFDGVYSSPTGRAFESTKLIFNERSDITINTHDGLMELDMGVWEGKDSNFIKKEYPEEYNNFCHFPHLFNLNKKLSSESFYDAQVRVIKAINEITSWHESGNIMIVSHCIAINVFLNHIENKTLKRLWEDDCIDGGSLVHIIYNEGLYNILHNTDKAHFEEVNE